MKPLRVLLLVCQFVSLSVWAQLPDCAQVQGWSQDGPPRSYEPDNLYDYMDGNAEGYLIYRFAKMNGITCKCGEDTIVIDISEMADPEYAYGIFLANRDPRQPTRKIGMAGQILPRKATFAKDKYYVELAANPAKDHTASLEKYVAMIDKSISGQSEPPAVTAWFPASQMVPNSLRLIPQSVLGLRILKSGYTVQYDFGKAFLIREASPEAAKQVFAKLKERVGQPAAIQVGEEGFSGTDKYLDGMWVFRKGAVIAGFANLKEARDITALATEFAGKIE
ncbi:MAG: hypothetical protein EHM61_07120 [Acidobacteria bacterium]|nr:MAG: hypothetical protein EHM61_07120 [Acidobacteriota bacterium]